MENTALSRVEELAGARRFTLSFKNAAEDIPRLITCYGRCCGGETALVLRPDEGRSAFVKVSKDKALASWSQPTDRSDAPREPDLELTPKDAVKRIKVEQMALQKAAAITLKGQWKGHMACFGSGGHKVVLRRKVASYGTLFVFSEDTRWSWKVVRDERWFTDTREKWGGSRPTLKQAIQAGLAEAMNLLGEACSVRDSHRRAALDEGYAATHPIEPAREGKDPISRLKEPTDKPTRGKRKKGDAETTLSLVPSPLNAPIALSAPPAQVKELRDAAREIADEAAVYTRLKEIGWIWSYTPEADLWYGALLDMGLDDLVNRIQGWFDAPSRKPAELLEELQGQLDAKDLTAADRHRADQAIEQLERELKRGPALLTRARWLIRYAANAVSSRLCQGRDREEASTAIEQAAAEYEAIRKLIEPDGDVVDPLREEDPKLNAELSRRLRALGKGIALAAAKLARSCATGQQTVTALLGGRKTGQATGAENIKGERKGRPSERQSAVHLLLPSKEQNHRFGRLFAKFLEDAGLLDRFAAVDPEDRDQAAITIKNAPWQDLAIEWVITPNVSGWPVWKISMAHYTEQNGDRFADLEVLLRVNDGQLADHAFIKAGGFDTAPGPDNELMRTWLKNLRDQGFVEATRRQLGINNDGASPACACTKGGPPTVATLLEDKSYQKPTDVKTLKKLLAQQDFSGNRRRALRDWVIAAFTFLLRDVKPAQVDVTLAKDGSPDRVEVDVELDWKADAELVSQLGRQVGIQVFARYAAAARTATSPASEEDQKYGKLVIVPLYGTPKSAEELVPYLTGATSAYKAEPSIHLAKKWVKSACLRLELDAVEIKGNNDGGIGVYVVHLNVKNDVTAPEVKAKLAIVHEAITLLSLSFRLVVKGEVSGDKPPTRPTRGRRNRPATSADVPTQPAPGNAANTNDPLADADKDAILMDTITSAIQKALGNGGN